MIITLTGENTFAASQAEHQVVRAFIAKHSANGVERVDAELLDAARLPDLLQGATLFSPSRLVVFKNISQNKSVQEPLQKAFGTLANGTTVIIADPNLDKRTKLYKFLKSQRQFQEFALLPEHQLTTWLIKTAEAADAGLSKEDAAYLISRAGRDQWRLYNEIQKMAGQQITRTLINELVEPSPEGTAFELLDAALAGKTQLVVDMLQALKTTEDPYKLFGLLASQTHALAVAAVAGNRAADTIAKDSGLHPFVVRKAQAAVKRLGHPRMQRIAQEVADCDWHIKSTGQDPWHLLLVTLQKIAL
ncbi:MAG TPA: DNA polymerase III subunit delta [Candidatus Saccharimonadales bacterium]|nr:DNA polymerase III subunit delta [Candidatus Saccharimonadales bacterium]